MQTITVDMTPGFRQPTIHYSQNDVGTTFAIDLRSRFGDTLPASPTVKIQATKPSGFGFSIEADSVVGSVATFTTVDTMTDEAGRFLAELEISEDSVVLYTANFYMEGEANPHPIGTTDGSQETIIPTLTLLVERVEAAAASVLDMTVNATTLAAGSQATYSYDEDANTATFGIPQGEAGAGAAGVTASAYSASRTYAVGDYVIHNNNLYRCTTAITTAEAFTAAHWTQVVLGDDVCDLKSEINKLTPAKSINLIDLKTLVDGVYISNSNGTEVAYSTWSATDYIEIEPKKYYQFVSTLNGNYAETGNVYFAFYDASKTYISGGRNNEINTTVSPDNARYIRLSTITDIFTGYGAMYGKPTDFESIVGSGLSAFVPYWQLVDGIKTVYVSNNGTDVGDFKKIADAVKFADGTEEINILIYPGTYDILDELGGAAYLATVPSLSGATGGLNLPNKVNLIGIDNNRLKTFLRANCADYPSLSADVINQCVTKTSVINMNQSNTLKNLLIVSQNTRYTIHDESNNLYQDYKREIENCEVTHNGNDAAYSWTSIAALGCGSGSGATYKYKDCKFKAKTPYSIHDNTGFTFGNNICFENCEFVADSSDGVAVRFGTVSGEAETITHNVVLNNCSLKGAIGQYEEGGKGRKWFVHGGGNTVVPYFYTLTSDSAVSKPIAFDEETIEVTNGSDSTIAKGTPVYMDSLKVKPMGTSDISRFYGVALEDIASGASGFIKTSGFLYRKDTPLSSWGIGTKLGIVNGAIASVSGDDYIAIGVAWDCARIVAH